MNPARRRFFTAALVFGVAFGATNWWSRHHTFHYLDGDTTAFVASFPAPAPPDSAATRAELAELLDLQATRTEAQVAAARADRKKDVARFYGALGLDTQAAAELPKLQALTDEVEADTATYVRAAKDKFRRLRPGEIEPRLKPCIDDVRADLSYPSGHATYGYVVALVLMELVPERQISLARRADEFARQRMVCGVHFRSDLEAGRTGASFLVAAMRASPEYRRDAAAAAAELRKALKLPPRS
jgi:acid phosphatase (class A)